MNIDTNTNKSENNFNNNRDGYGGKQLDPKKYMPSTLGYNLDDLDQLDDLYYLNQDNLPDLSNLSDAKPDDHRTIDEYVKDQDQDQDQKDLEDFENIKRDYENKSEEQRLFDLINLDKAIDDMRKKNRIDKAKKLNTSSLLKLSHRETGIRIEVEKLLNELDDVKEARDKIGKLFKDKKDKEIVDEGLEETETESQKPQDKPQEPVKLGDVDILVEDDEDDISELSELVGILDQVRDVRQLATISGLSPVGKVKAFLMLHRWFKGQFPELAGHIGKLLGMVK